MIRRFLLAISMLWTLSPPSSADEISLTPVKDNTLYESTSDELSNGAGNFLFTGRTGQGSGSIRRTLLAFDVAGSVPAGATITDATLSMSMTKTAAAEVQDASLHRVLQDWGEAGSDASVVGEGQGVTAEEGDVTWLHTFWPSDPWTTAGGDFAATPTDTIAIEGEEIYTWGTSGELVSDIQRWLDDPMTNFGWIVVGDESIRRTALRFDSRSSPDQASRPTLSVRFELSLTGDCNGDGVVDIQDVACACLSTEFALEDILAATGLVQGDVDGDGSVAFSDFLVLSTNFGQEGGYTDGDLNCDGNVAFSDFLLLSGNFGIEATSVAVSVPEPSPQVLLGVSALLLLVNRKRWNV